MDGDLIAIFDCLDHLVDVREIQPRINALRVHVERQRDDVDIAGALAVSEQAALDTVRARQQPQFGRGDAGAAIIVGVQADHHRLAASDVSAEPLDLVGIYVGRRRLDRGRQVEDQRALGGRAQDVHHCLADLDREIELGGREGLRAILEMPVGIGLLGGLVAQHLGAGDRDALDLLAAHAEHDAAPCRRDGIVEMNDRLFRALQALEAGLDQVLARLGEHLDDHVVGDPVLPDQARDEIELGGTRARKADFDLLHAHLAEQLEEAGLLLGIHRVDQRLVAVAHVGRQPAGRLGDGAARPLAAGQVYLGERTIFDTRIAQHDSSLSAGDLGSDL